MARVADPLGLVDVVSDVLPLAEDGFARVQADAHPDRDISGGHSCSWMERARPAHRCT